jgi:hypothetical protein
MYGFVSSQLLKELGYGHLGANMAGKSESSVTNTESKTDNYESYMHVFFKG